jgi:replicative DNA helicase
LVEAAGRLADAPIFIDDTPALSVLEMRAKSRRLKAECGLGLLVVDYLQLMRGRKATESREQEISDISRSLKTLAKELNIPIIALSQLNRQVEARSDRRPQLADLRESGAIEQDADVIIFIYRDEVYNKSPDNQNRGIAEVIIGKQRNGPVGVVKLAFLSNCTRFENYYSEEGSIVAAN